MKKKILTTALLSLLCAPMHAESTTQPIPAPTNSNGFQAPAAPEPEHESTIPAAPKTTPTINCEYNIPASTTIDQTVLATWAEKATMQSFDFNPTDLETQLEKLKPCFTEQGWQSFHDAFESSGNIKAIQLQNLTVSSQMDGKLSINPIKESQWKIAIRLQVVYQNDKEKLTQLLSIDLLVGRRASGNLGIMQIIATPRQADVSKKSNP